MAHAHDTSLWLDRSVAGRASEGADPTLRVSQDGRRGAAMHHPTGPNPGVGIGMRMGHARRWSRGLQLPLTLTLMLILSGAPAEANPTSGVELDELDQPENLRGITRGWLGDWHHVADDDTYENDEQGDQDYANAFDELEGYAYEELDADQYNSELVYQDHFGARFNQATDFNTTEEAAAHRAMLEAADLEELELAMEREGVDENERRARRRLHKKDRGIANHGHLYCDVGYGELGRNKDEGLKARVNAAQETQWIRYCGNTKQGATCFNAETKQWRDMKDIYPDVNWMKEKDYYNKYWIKGCGGNFHFLKEGPNSASCKNNNPGKNKGSGIWVAYNNDKTAVAEKSFYDRKDYWFECENDEYATDDVKYDAESGVSIGGSGDRCNKKGKRYLRFETVEDGCCDHEDFCDGPASCGKSCETEE